MVWVGEVDIARVQNPEVRVRAGGGQCRPCGERSTRQTSQVARCQAAAVFGLVRRRRVRLVSRAMDPVVGQESLASPVNGFDIGAPCPMDEVSHDDGSVVVWDSVHEA